MSFSRFFVYLCDVRGTVNFTGVEREYTREEFQRSSSGLHCAYGIERAGDSTLVGRGNCCATTQ